MFDWVGWVALYSMTLVFYCWMSCTYIQFGGLGILLLNDQTYSMPWYTQTVDYSIFNDLGILLEWVHYIMTLVFYCWMSCTIFNDLGILLLNELHYIQWPWYSMLNELHYIQWPWYSTVEWVALYSMTLVFYCWMSSILYSMTGRWDNDII